MNDCGLLSARCGLSELCFLTDLLGVVLLLGNEQHFDGFGTALWDGSCVLLFAVTFLVGCLVLASNVCHSFRYDLSQMAAGLILASVACSVLVTVAFVCKLTFVLYLLSRYLSLRDFKWPLTDRISIEFEAKSTRLREAIFEWFAERKPQWSDGEWLPHDRVRIANEVLSRAFGTVDDNSPLLSSASDCWSDAALLFAVSKVFVALQFGFAIVCSCILPLFCSPQSPLRSVYCVLFSAVVFKLWSLRASVCATLRGLADFRVAADCCVDSVVSEMRAAEMNETSARLRCKLLRHRFGRFHLDTIIRDYCGDINHN